MDVLGCAEVLDEPDLIAPRLEIREHARLANTGRQVRARNADEAIAARECEGRPHQAVHELEVGRAGAERNRQRSRACACRASHPSASRRASGTFARRAAALSSARRHGTRASRRSARPRASCPSPRTDLRAAGDALQSRAKAHARPCPIGRARPCGAATYALSGLRSLLTRPDSRFHFSVCRFKSASPARVMR
jgi:hypothetical protein